MIKKISSVSYKKFNNNDFLKIVGSKTTINIKELKNSDLFCTKTNKEKFIIYNATIEEIQSLPENTIINEIKEF